VPSTSPRLNQQLAHAKNTVNNRRIYAEPFSDSAALLGQHLDCLANSSSTGRNGSHSPIRSLDLDETLDLLDGLNCEVSDVTL
jgi:hypothetical protein